jgi:hypothetical protein
VPKQAKRVKTIYWREIHPLTSLLFPPSPYAPLDSLSSFYAIMLTLEPGSLCDVCADEFGPRNLPHSIPCGQFSLVFCLGKFSLSLPLLPFRSYTLLELLQ